LSDLKRTGAQLAIADVVGDGGIKQRHLLWHQGGAAAQSMQVDVGDGNVIDGDAVPIVGREPQDQIEDGALARSPSV
jgi:hypothetical protein